MPPSHRTPEIRKDTVNNRLVILSPARSKRPSDFKSKSNPSNPSPNSNSCPFCAGNEHQCAPEIFRSPEHSTSSDWKVRCIENLYPALSRDVNVNVNGGDVIGSGVVTSGFGFHDVIIETPEHEVKLSGLDKEGVKDVLLAFKKRIHQLSVVDAVRYVQVFKNHGASAGASLSHSHSQILALPVIPTTASTRLDSMKEYHNQTGRCILCDIKTDQLLIDETSHFISIAPFASTFAFETWIVPRYHSSHYHELDEDSS